MDRRQLQAIIQRAPTDHPLRSSSDNYRESFITAFLDVYGGKTDSQIEKILKGKLLVGTGVALSLDTYLQGASELSVAHHIKQRGVASFETDRKVNPTNKKDVDVFFKLGVLSCSIEVKCAQEPKEPSGLAVRTAGRLPDHQAMFDDLSGHIPGLSLAKNKDNTLKDFLVEASQKFNPSSGVDDLNILFVACGDHHNMNSWYLYLCGPEGLFTGKPFWSPSEYGMVDAVILSSLKYRHEQVRSSADWTLQDTLIIPFVNPHKRAAATRESILSGLAVFDHYLKPFFDFVPGPPEIPADVLASVKVIHYVAECLSPSERARYFPTAMWP